MKIVRVPLKHNPYAIRIGPGLLSQTPKWLKGFSEKRAYVFYDDALPKLARKLESALTKAGWAVHSFPVKASEKLKDFGKLQSLYGKLLQHGANRRSLLFALGGGTVGDAVGFVAATTMRGIPWVSIPTTLLAQVDSGIGGKTAVNLDKGKNLIGAFHQPCLVLCDLDALKTLPLRDRISGLGEIFKYALLFDDGYLQKLKRDHRELVRLEPHALQNAVFRCASWKARIVSEDEHDKTGLREILNFGHTVGHALEAATDFGTFRHGEAVLWGMRVALALSELRNHMAPGLRSDLDDILDSVPVPPIPPRLTLSKLLRPMRFDKKTQDGKTRFVLMMEPGRTLTDKKITAAQIRKAFAMVGAPLAPGR